MDAVFLVRMIGWGARSDFVLCREDCEGQAPPPRLGYGEVEIAGDTYLGGGERCAFPAAVSDFFADDGAQLGVARFFGFVMADSSYIKIRTISDVALIFF